MITVFKSKDVNGTTMVQIKRGSGQSVVSILIVVFLKNMKSQGHTVNHCTVKVFDGRRTYRKKCESVFVCYFCVFAVSQDSARRRTAAERLNRRSSYSAPGGL